MNEIRGELKGGTTAPSPRHRCAAAVPFEFHLYARGRHGLSLGAPFDWDAECLRWIGELGASTD